MAKSRAEGSKGWQENIGRAPASTVTSVTILRALRKQKARPFPFRPEASPVCPSTDNVSDNIVALSALAAGHTHPRMVVVDVQNPITKRAPRIRVSIRDLQSGSKLGNKGCRFHAGAA